MFLPFFQGLRREGVPVSLREYLGFLEGLSRGLCTYDIDAFYHFARLSMVKDERYLDRFDRAFAASFSGLEAIPTEAVLEAINLPAAWLEKLAEKILSPEERAEIEALGGFDKLMETLRQRLAEQDGRHQGGNKWVGTAGTSPFGAYGYNPEGVRIGQDKSRHQRAVKVWDKREFRDFDDTVELGTRNIKVALKRLRNWARKGAEEELDLPATIRASAEAGHIDVVMRPERHNAVKLVLFLDIGGSMDAHVKGVEELFSAARAEFKHLEHYYFHNCLYEGVWRDNRRRWDEKIPTMDLLHRFGPDWKCLFVGDASMSPYELTHAGGANEHWNPEPGVLWLQRSCETWRHHAWLNPVPEPYWRHTPTIKAIRDIFGGNMYPLTLEGITAAMKALG